MPLHIGDTLCAIQTGDRLCEIIPTRILMEASRRCNDDIAYVSVMKMYMR